MGGRSGAGGGLLAWLALLGCMGARASPGDTIAKTDFRKEPWGLYAPKGTGSDKGMELDYAQNLIKLKDGGDYNWWFQSPPSFFSGDRALAYNGTIEVHIQSLEWENSFKADYDVVLVSTNKFYTVGLKGVKRDGDTSRVYSVHLSEAAGWEFVNPKIRQGQYRYHVSKDNLITCLKSLVGIRIRGGYFRGVEKTQLRVVRVIQGIMAGDEHLDPLQTDSCCGEKERECQGEARLEMVFNNPGVPCRKMVDLHTGKITIGDSTLSTAMHVRLDTINSSPVNDFYVGKTLVVSSTSSLSPPQDGKITNYLGKLEWKTNSGVSDIHIVEPGSDCSTGGKLSDLGGEGDGFVGEFEVEYTIPSVTIADGGVGCGGATRKVPIVSAINATTGEVTALDTSAWAGSADSYLKDRPAGDYPAMVECLDPCTGSGLQVECTHDGAGDVMGATIINGGLGYVSAHRPTVRCAEGAFTFTDDPAVVVAPAGAPHAQMQGYFYTNNNLGPIVGIVVSNPGSAYQGPVTISVTHKVSTCADYELTPYLSGYVTAVSVIENGANYTDAPLTIFQAGGGLGCQGVMLQTSIGDMTADLFYDDANFSAVAAAPPAPAYDALHLGLSASKIDGHYDGMTIVITKGGASARTAAASATIVSYVANGRIAYIATGTLTDAAGGAAALPALGDGYAITPAVKRAVSDKLARDIDFLTPMTGALGAAVSCKCVSTTTPYTSIAGCSSACGADDCVCTVGLDTANAPATADYYAGQTISFTRGTTGTFDKTTRPLGSATIIAYDALRVATIAVRGSKYKQHAQSLTATQADAANLMAGTGYVVSQDYIATVAFEDPTAAAAFFLAVPLADVRYTIQYQDESPQEYTHAQARPYYCDQPVGDNPKSAWIPVPFIQTFAFKSVPLICGVGTLTIAAEGYTVDDVIWKDNDLTMVGENGEDIGVFFREDSHYIDAGLGGPIYDTIAISQEKMLEMTQDGDFVFQLKTRSGFNGKIRFRTMTLGFTPAACFSGKVTTDEFKVRYDEAGRYLGVDWDVMVPTPLGADSVPSSDGVITVTADADLTDGKYLELHYTGSEGVTMFKDWVWGTDFTNYTLVEPADVATVCTGAGAYPDFFCKPNLQVSRSQTRDGRHTANHRVPRRLLTQMVAGGSAALELKVVGAPLAKLSPIRLGYTLLNCHMQTLIAGRDGQSFGAHLFRPSFPSFTFPRDAPPAGGDATLWVHAIMQHHDFHVKDSLGLPSQSPRTLRNDQGDHYDVALKDQRDPEADFQYEQSRWPHLGALGLHTGEQGEFIGWLFNEDYAQYDPAKGYVSSISIPKRIMTQFGPDKAKKITLSFDVPPGTSTIRVMSATIAYPDASA